MTRTSFSLATVFVLALAGCANKTNEQTQTPDGAEGGAVDGSGGGGEETAATPSRARKSTAPRGAGRNTKARKMTAAKPPRAPSGEVPGGEETGPNGLTAEAFKLDSAEALPDFSSFAEPVQRFEVPNLDYDEVEASSGFPGLDALQDNYALRFSGSINIVEEAEYELCLHSDDGSQLLLEDTLVVDNDGVHDAPVETCELVYLAAGEYRLQINYFQGSGPALALHFAWAVNGGEKSIVPTEALFKP